jgi:hypothetical protein
MNNNPDAQILGYHIKQDMSDDRLKTMWLKIQGMVGQDPIEHVIIKGIYVLSQIDMLTRDEIK